MPDTAIPLSNDFAPATRADWLALVEKTLKGAGVDSLTSRGPDGVAILPLYEGSLAQRTFVPGPRGDERPWDIRARVAHSNPASAREAVLDELAGGAASVILALDDGYGNRGIGARSAASLTDVLDGVLVDIAPIALDAGFLGAKAADWLSAAAKGSPAAPLTFHLDPLSAFALSGASPGPIESHLIACANVAARLAPIHPRASLFLASGAVAHEAGGTPAQELAFAIASALVYAKALNRAGLAIDVALGGVVLGLTADTDPLVSIAKLRAARMVWTRLAGACGATAPAVIEARSSRRMMTRVDSWTNMVRLTAAGFAAAVGGADAVVLGAFTDAAGSPTPFARRAARNTQLILMEEGHLGAVVDPVAGSGAFEAVSRDLAHATWTQFNAIEAAGGLVAALRDGLIARQVETGRGELKAALAGGGARVVGVTDFAASQARPAAIDETPAPSTPPPDTRLPGPDSRCAPLTPVTLEDLAQ